jgi:putative inorganic carbon (hco3(-)) transporter
VPILIFIIGILVGLLVSPNKAVAIGTLASTLASILIYYGLVSNGQRGSWYWLSVGGIIFGITFSLGIWFFSQGTARHVFFNEWFFKLFEALPKTEGPVLQFNSLGALLAVTIPVLCAIAIFNRHWLIRSVSSSLSLILFGMLILSASGGGWIAAFCGLAFLPFSFRKWTAWIVVPSTGVVVTVAVFCYSHTLWLQQIFSTGSLFSRVTMWENTLRLLSFKSAVAGLGLGNWASWYNNNFGESQIHVHNSFLQLYADTGILGVVALITATVVFIHLCTRILSQSPQRSWYGIGVGLIAAIFAGAIMAMYDVTATVTIMGISSYIYMSVPLLWVWAALLIVSEKKLAQSLPKAQKYNLASNLH